MKIAQIEVSPIHPERWGDDLDVVNAARVSMDKVSTYEKNGKFGGSDFDISEGDEKLIKYLAKHKHFSPFNHSFLSFRVKAPVFAARQLVKHKFMPWNETSRRYVDTEPEFYYPDGWRERGENVKQGSGEGFITDFINPWSGENGVLNHAVVQYIESSVALYDAMILAGVAPEQARMVLPQNMMCDWIWSGTLGAFLDMLVLRLDLHTQKESRDVANLIVPHIQKKFPVSFEARIKT